jgi:hypothetical protein
MEQVRNFIDLVAQGNNADAKSSLDELISARAFDALEAKKQQIATSLFADKSEEPVAAETEVETTEQEPEIEQPE